MWIVAPPTLAIWSIYAKKVIGCIFAPGQPSNKVGYGHVTGTCIHLGKRMAVLDPHLRSQQIGQADTLEGECAKALVLLSSWVTNVKLQQTELKCPQHLHHLLGFKRMQDFLILSSIAHKTVRLLL